ncbi:MAG: iron ABC transporter permease [Planctomycetota bacterium]
MAGRRRVVAVAFGAVGAVVLLCVARVIVGTTAVGFPEGADGWLVMRLRAERVWPALLVGASLALSGVALQGLLRNALAEPFVLGLASGAWLGAAVQAAVASAMGVWQGPLYAGAAVGSVVALGVVYLLGRRRGVIDPLGLLLAGIVAGTIAGSAVMLLRELSGSVLLRDEIARWALGYLDARAGAARLATVGAVLAAGWAWVWWVGRWMDAASLGEEEAEAMGVPLARLRAGLLVVASLLAAGAVVLSGPVAFVGLIAPHAARLVVGSGHRGLAVVAPVLGAGLVVAADTGSAGVSLATGIGELPVGVMAAVVGGPIFLVMLRRYLTGGELDGGER